MIEDGLHCGDCIEWASSLEDDSIDLLFTSPPYEAARTYSIAFALKEEAWVSWMVNFVMAFAPKVKGLIAINCEGQTKNYRYSNSPFLLMADLHRAGFNLRKPAVFHRVGIPGSGGPDWLRNDWEPIICITRPGKLPWSDNTACGHAPKWGLGGEMSHRISDGTRRNQWGGSAKSGCHRLKDGTMANGTRASHKLQEKRKTHLGRGTAHEGSNGTTKGSCASQPTIANPGNVLKFNVGGGQMGSPLAHENEAPFPLGLADFFVLSFSPPDGLVCDPFFGSGTTLHSAKENGRRFIGCDIRQSQLKIAKRRLSGITPSFI